MLLICAVVLVASCQAATIAPTSVCKNSQACGPDMCCRSATGDVISDMEQGGFGGHFPMFGGATQNGTCSTRLAQKGEICDNHYCKCDVGLACYRPMSGVCCPPHTCYDEAYVKQQQAYWANCFSDPNCAIPP